MAVYHIFPATYVWDGTQWVLALPTWWEGGIAYLQQSQYSANGTTWTT